MLIQMHVCDFKGCSKVLDQTNGFNVVKINDSEFELCNEHNSLVYADIVEYMKDFKMKEDEPAVNEVEAVEQSVNDTTNGSSETSETNASAKKRGKDAIAEFGEDKIRDLINQGYTYSKIASLVGVHAATIKKFCVKQGFVKTEEKEAEAKKVVAEEPKN